MDTRSTDIAVIGGGPAGLAAALALAVKGRIVTLFAPEPLSFGGQSTDTRTTAVLGDGIAFLDNIGAWSALAGVSAPLVGVRIIDDRGGWMTAPEVLFDARETGRANFGANIPNDPLRDTLLARVHATPTIACIAANISAVTPRDDHVVLRTDAGDTITAPLVVAADGRHSLARAAANIAVRRWQYPQTAVTMSFGHTRPHGGISNELHRAPGPLTTVPLPCGPDGPRSSLVWVERPAEAQRLLALTDSEFLAELDHHLAPVLGPLRNVGPRGAFPLAGLMAATMARNRVVLVGKSAHVVPPIGAQGLNLGFRDAATLADVTAGVADPGAPAVLEAYARARSADLVSREIGIDLLNRSLLSDLPPVQAARGLALHALANSAHLRRAAMAMGLSPPSRAPSLMQSLANHA